MESSLRYSFNNIKHDEDASSLNTVHKININFPKQCYLYDYQKVHSEI